MSTEIEPIYAAFRASAGVATDTRSIAPGTLFIALRGEHFDANQFVAQALDKGAAYVVTTNSDFAADRRVFIVEDTLATLQQLALRHRQSLDIPIIGITGTNGKTTTKELVTAVLGRKFRVKSTTGNLNNHIGVPLTLLSLGPDTEMAVVEMGANHPGEIAALCRLSLPTAGLVTNVGIAHLAGFGSFEGVKRTKAELYASVKERHGVVFIDPDSHDLSSMLGEYDRVQPYLTGRALGNGAQLRLDWIHEGRALEAQTQLAGLYNLKNCLAAATVGAFYGVPDSEVVAALVDYQPSLGRSQLLSGHRNRVVLDAYNANPTSMAAAIDNLATTQPAPLAVVLGGMRELGEASNELHRNVLKQLRDRKIEQAVLIGSEFEQLKAEFPGYQYCPDTEAARPLCRLISGCAVLVKGSNSNHLAPLAEEL